MIKMQAVLYARMLAMMRDDPGVNMDVRLNPGRSAADSLRETAEEWREEARRLQHRANLLSLAASKLDEDVLRGRQFSSRGAA